MTEEICGIYNVNGNLFYFFSNNHMVLIIKAALFLEVCQSRDKTLLNKRLKKHSKKSLDVFTDAWFPPGR